MKFSYGICDFYKIITEQYYYVDRTDRISLIEEAGEQLLFLRPRRFGKSLLLSMLENYYDIAKAEEFERLFGHLAIGQNPTGKHHQYFVLTWDFSTINPQGEPEEIQQAIYDHINGCIAAFARYYRSFLTEDIHIHPTNALASFQSLLTLVRQTPYRLYLMIDEYDNFANEVFMSHHTKDQQRYEALLYGEGTLKTIFKAVKSASAGRGLDRVFITGVSPVVLSDITSGYNIAENISLLPLFNDLCGFRESELVEILQKMGDESSLSAGKMAEALSLMQTFYNGYRFCYTSDTPASIYNSTLVLYFLKTLQRESKYPSNMLDSNLGMDQQKLAFVSQLPYGEQVIQEALNEERPLSIEAIAGSFGVSELLQPEKSMTFAASLLYFLGILTLNGRSPMGKLLLQIPNLVVRKLYIDRIQKTFLPDFDKYEASQAAEIFFSTGNIRPVCEFVEQRYFQVFDNRDYRWTNELTIKTAFLTLLFNDLFYIMDSETALQRDYADLVMIVRPDMRQYQLLDILIEFKYISLSESGLTGEQVRAMSDKEINALPPVQQKLQASQEKLASYRHTLETTYGETLRLRTYTVVALAFDRVVWQEFEK